MVACACVCVCWGGGEQWGYPPIDGWVLTDHLCVSTDGVHGYMHAHRESWLTVNCVGVWECVCVWGGGCWHTGWGGWQQAALCI